MANNRMYLVHKPSGNALYLGKHAGQEWHNQPGDLGDRLAEFWKECWQDYGGNESYAIAMECSDDPSVITDWVWDEEERTKGRLVMKLEEPDAR